MVKHRLIGVRQTAVAAMLLLSAPVMAQDVTAEDPMNAMIARLLSQRRETVGDTVIKVNTDTVFFDVSLYSVTGALHDGNLRLPRPIGYIRTNLIGDAVLIPNVGFEITLGRSYRWTLGTDFYLQWIKRHWQGQILSNLRLDGGFQAMVVKGQLQRSSPWMAHRGSGLCLHL